MTISPTTSARQVTLPGDMAVSLGPLQKHGVVYTKPWVVDLILDLAGYTPTADLGMMVAIEPAAGDGCFVIAMAERLISACRHHNRSLLECQQALISYERDPEATALARNALLRVLTGHGIALEEANALADCWVRTGDYLLDAPLLPPADFVIGNPPYVRLEDMNAVSADQYRRRYKTMVGRADLYVAFFEAALKQLKLGGVCAYICADRWMLNQYGAELRHMITSSYNVETVIEMHRADPFALEVDAYPAITVIRRNAQSEVVIARTEAGIADVDPTAISQAITNCRVTLTPTSRLPGLRAARVDSWFRGAEPWPCSSPERITLLKHLEAEFYPLESAGTGTKVGIGVATGADDLFITNDRDIVEPSRLLPLAMASDTRGGELSWSGHYLINPWNDHGLVDLNKFPKLNAYLSMHEQRLRGRHVGKRNVQGWYRTIDRVDHHLSKRAKLYIPDIKDRLNPVLDRGETYPHHNLYFVQSAVWDPEVLGGLLLSDVAQFFIECYGVRMRGGYLRFQAQYLRRIRIPRPSDITSIQADGLRRAFRERSRMLATQTALLIYGIDHLPEEEAVL